MDVAISLILSLLACALLAFRFLRPAKPRSSSGARKAPGPKPLPLVGNSLLFRGVASPFVKFTELAARYGDVYSVTMGTTPVLVVSGLEPIKSVLLENGKFFGGRPDFIRYHKLFDGDRQNSLALCDWSGVQVKRRSIARKHCSPRPQSPLRKTIAEIGDFEMREFVSALRSRPSDRSIKPVVMSTCLNLFCQYMCSVRFDAGRDAEFDGVVRLFDEIFWEINQGRAVDFFPWLSPLYARHMAKLNDWSHKIRAFILSRVVEARELDLDDEEEDRDFTDGLLKALKHEPQLSRDAILFTLEDFLGGSSAVGNFSSLVLLHAAREPRVQAEIQAEIDEVTGKRRPVSLDDADRLPYTQAALRETLRYTSSPIVPHVATEDAVVCGHSVEKGTVVVLNNHKLNMSPELWDAPERFDPDRFLERSFVEVKGERRGSDHDSGVESESESKKRNRCISASGDKCVRREVVSLKPVPPHFMPFSAGRRTCLGKGLLQHYGLLVVATVLQNFDVACDDSLTFRDACLALPPDAAGFTLTPRKIR